jgi:hypothetical protein
MIVRAFECGEDQMPSLGRKSRELIENDFTEVSWEHSHVVVDETGKVHTYCIYEAPDEATVLAHGAQLGMHGIVSIDEIAGDVTPADFPAV